MTQRSYGPFQAQPATRTYPAEVQPPEADSQSEDHVHAGYKDFGLKGMARALCTCGYATPPVQSTEAALHSLLYDHGARPRRPGEKAGVPY